MKLKTAVAIALCISLGSMVLIMLLGILAN